MTPKRISVRVKPRASRDKVEATAPDQLTVWTTASPADNQANEAVRELIAEHFGVAKSRVTLFRGAASRDKVFEIG